MKEFKVWLRYTNNSFQQVISRRALALIFLVGKCLRILMFLMFLNYIFKKSSGMAGYTREQIIFFYLTFNLIDSLGQLFYREVYRFRSLVVSGGLDFVLVKPINPLIRVLAGGADVLDLIVVGLVGGITLYFGFSHISMSIGGWFVYVIMVINGLALATAFHILVLALGIISTSVDHMVMIYRDLSSMMRIPVDLYSSPVKFLFTFVIPLGIMLTFPAKALMGILSRELIVWSLVFGGLSLWLALKIWTLSLRHYSSASS